MCSGPQYMGKQLMPPNSLSADAVRVSHHSSTPFVWRKSIYQSKSQEYEQAEPPQWSRRAAVVPIVLPGLRWLWGHEAANTLSVNGL